MIGREREGGGGGGKQRGVGERGGIKGYKRVDVALWSSNEIEINHTIAI